jgi:CDP-diacylglycerol---serine O-phosphatidyltransferase
MAMREPDQQEFGFIEPRNHRLRRGVYLLPSAFTIGNLLCGFYAVLATVKGGIVDLDYAARAIGLAIVFDAFDGFIARATHTNTEFGKQFDSLADMVSFGVAPAILAYTWGVRTIAQSDIPEARHIYDLAWVVSLAFALCCGWRLARFNVHGMAPGAQLRYFVGMPTPAAAGMIAAVVHAWKVPIEDWRWSAAWLMLVLVLAGLMVSTVRYPSFKGIPWGRRQHSLIIVVVGLAGSIVIYSEIVLLLIAATYTVAGLTIHVVRLLRHRLVSRTA